MKIRNLIRLNTLLKQIGFCLSVCLFISLYFNSYAFSQSTKENNSIISFDLTEKQSNSFVYSIGFQTTIDALSDLEEIDDDDDDDNNDKIHRHTRFLRRPFGNLVYTPSQSSTTRQPSKLYLKYCCIRIHLV